MTNKIRIQNVKTGKVSEVTSFAWNTLKSGGKSKFFEILNKPTEPVKFNAPKIVEPQPVTPIEEISDIELESETHSMDDIQSNGTEFKAMKKGRKPKN